LQAGEIENGEEEEQFTSDQALQDSPTTISSFNSNHFTHAKINR